MTHRRLAAAAALLCCFASGVHAQVTLSHIGRYQSQAAKFDTGTAEIVAYDKPTRRVFVVNAQEATVDVLDVSDLANPVKIGRIDLKAIPGFDPAKIGVANSVAARDGLLAVAVEAAPKTDPGLIAFYDTASDFSQPVAPLKAVTTGAQPDAVAFSNTGHFVVSANDGDARDPVGSRPGSTSRVKDLPLPLCGGAFQSEDAIGSNPRDDKNLGRLNVITHLGKDRDTSGADCYGALYALGGRSFSILTDDGRMVYDSANEFESKIDSLTCPASASDCSDYALPEQAFYATHNNNFAGSVPGESNDTFDSRSDDKGPEPEGIAVGRVGSRTYAFIGLERIGGVMIYDVTVPAQSFFVDYVSYRDFNRPVCTPVNANGTCADATPNPAPGDLGPEGLAFVAAEDSPNGRPLLIVGNEVSGSTSLFEIVPVY